MQTPVPSLSPRLSDALDAFRESGVNPTDAEIVWLGKLREKCDNPADCSVPWVMGAPLEYGGVKWYSMHRLAESWFLRAFKLLDGDDMLQIMAFLFAHANSNIGNTTVRDFMSESSMREMLFEWGDDLAIHEGQLAELCETLRKKDGQSEQVPDVNESELDQEDTITNDSVPQSIAALCKAFPGVSPEYWLTDISSNDAMLMMASVGNSGGWAESETRRNAVENWLKGIKWVWKNHHGK